MQGVNSTLYSFSPSAQYLVIGSSINIRIVDIGASSVVYTYPQQSSSKVKVIQKQKQFSGCCSIAWTKDNTSIVCGLKGGDVIMLNYIVGKVSWTQHFSRQITNIDINSERQVVVSIEQQGLAIIDLDNGKTLKLIDSAEYNFQKFRALQGTALIFGGSFSLETYDTLQEHSCSKYSGHPEYVTAINVVPNSLVGFTSCENDHRISVWNLQNKKYGKAKRKSYQSQVPDEAQENDNETLRSAIGNIDALDGICQIDSIEEVLEDQGVPMQIDNESSDIQDQSQQKKLGQYKLLVTSQGQIKIFEIQIIKQSKIKLNGKKTFSLQTEAQLLVDILIKNTEQDIQNQQQISKVLKVFSSKFINKNEVIVAFGDPFMPDIQVVKIDRVTDKKLLLNSRQLQGVLMMQNQQDGQQSQENSEPKLTKKQLKQKQQQAKIGGPQEMAGKQDLLQDNSNQQLKVKRQIEDNHLENESNHQILKENGNNNTNNINNISNINGIDLKTSHQNNMLQIQKLSPEDLMELDIQENKLPQEAVTLGQRLEAIQQSIESDSQQEDELDIENQQNQIQVSANSISIQLSQGIQSGDKRLIESCLQVQNNSVVNNSIRQISAVHACMLLQNLIEILTQKPNRAGQLSIWFSSLIKYHAGYMLSSPQAQNDMAILNQILEERLVNFRSIMSLRGRLDLCLSQIQSKQEESQQKHEPRAVIYEEELNITQRYLKSLNDMEKNKE